MSIGRTQVAVLGAALLLLFAVHGCRQHSEPEPSNAGPAAKAPGAERERASSPDEQLSDEGDAKRRLKKGGQQEEGEPTAKARYWERTSEDIVTDRPRAVGPPLVDGELLPSLAPLVEHLTPTVVGVTTRVRRARQGPPLPPGIPMPPGTPREREEIGIGSGVIIDPDGLVVTNHHVIIGAESIEVRLADDRRYDAEVIGADPETDIAVLRLMGVTERLPAADLGLSDELRVGDYVIAIGNPFGLALTVTAGIISARARVIGTSPFDDFLQTDAAINPGNSGGPLFSMEGRVVGINTAIVAPGEGIGFAVPIDLVRDLLPQLVDDGRVVRGYLGVVVQDLTPRLAEEMGAEVEQGAMVVSVERRGPGDRGGVRAGDIIVAVDGEPVRSAATLSRLVASRAPGDTIELGAVRNGRSVVLELSLGERPPRDALPSAP